MKTYLLLFVLAITLFAPAVLAEEQELSPQKQMEIRNLQLNIEEREMEMDFHRQIKQLELKKHALGMEDWAQKKKYPADAKRHHKKAGFKRHHGKCPIAIFAIIVTVHILLAIWVFQDIRKKSDSSGIWIVIALLTGLLGVLVYAVVRLGDIRKTSA